MSSVYFVACCVNAGVTTSASPANVMRTESTGVAGEGFKRRGDLVLQLRAQLSQLGVSTRIDLRVDAHARVVLVRDVNLDVVRGQA